MMNTESMKPITSTLQEMCMKKIINSLHCLNEMGSIQKELPKLLFYKLFNKGKDYIRWPAQIPFERR